MNWKHHICDKTLICVEYDIRVNVRKGKLIIHDFSDYANDPDDLDNCYEIPVDELTWLLRVNDVI